MSGIRPMARTGPKLRRLLRALRGLNSDHSLLGVGYGLWAGYYNHTTPNYREYFNDVWSSPDGANWTEVTASPGWNARVSPGVVSFNNRMWVMGGSDDSGDYNDVRMVRVTIAE